jgi:hypothetical protein
MKTARVTFADGNTLTTSINGTEEEIKAYYLGKKFQFGDTEERPHDHMVEAVKVEIFRKYKANFEGRERGAIGIFYPISTTTEGYNEDEAKLKLYDNFEHIKNLKLTAI